ncbi:hypothetical protein BASA83_013400 [Batrachochytrium salamandrivorans]|nr:hypothetical protein BASA83_013400 [Batrachochytrium salamandrivorans]
MPRSKSVVDNHIEEMKLNACLTLDVWSNIKNEPIVNYILISDSSKFFLKSVSTEFSQQCKNVVSFFSSHHQMKSLGQVQIGLQLCADEPRVKCKILRSPALSTGQAIGASLLSLARCGGLWDYPRALKAGLLHPTATDPRPAGQSQPVYTLSCSLGLQAHGPLGVLLGGSLPGTNTAGNTEACPGQQWLTGTVEEGNLLSSNQPVAHRMCDFLQISVRVYRAMLWKHHKSNLSHIPDI